MKKLAIFVVLILISNLIFAQTFLFNENESGFDIGAGFASTSSASSVGLSAGYTFNGKLNVGGGVGFYSFNDLGFNLTTIGPSVSFLALRQKEQEMPVSVTVSGSYQLGSQTYMNVPISMNSLAFTGTILRSIDINDNFKIIPAGQIQWSSASVDVGGIIVNNSSVSFAIEGIAVFNSKFYAFPKISFSGGSYSFSAGFGIIFPAKKTIS
jgi:hypothetical protein